MFGADLPFNMYIDEEPKASNGWNFDLEEYLIPSNLVPHPWNRQSASETHLDMDFILVAEFSELEGPREVVGTCTVRRAYSEMMWKNDFDAIVMNYIYIYL